MTDKTAGVGSVLGEGLAGPRRRERTNMRNCEDGFNGADEALNMTPAREKIVKMAQQAGSIAMYAPEEYPELLGVFERFAELVRSERPAITNHLEDSWLSEAEARVQALVNQRDELLGMLRKYSEQLTRLGYSAKQICRDVDASAKAKDAP